VCFFFLSRTPQVLPFFRLLSDHPVPISIFRVSPVPPLSFGTTRHVLLALTLSFLFVFFTGAISFYPGFFMTLL